MTTRTMKSHRDHSRGTGIRPVGAAALVSLALAFSAGFSGPAPAASPNPIAADCTYNGIKLFGRVKQVEYFPDIRVKIVNRFPDLRVARVDSMPTSCGRWQFVNNSPDFKIKIVETFPDITIEYVDAFPGKTEK